MTRSSCRGLAAATAVAMVTLFNASSIEAGPRTDAAIKGAVIGAAVGTLIGGSDGAKTGAAVGAITGNLSKAK